MSTTGTSFICSFVLKLLLFLKVFTFFFTYWNLLVLLFLAGWQTFCRWGALVAHSPFLWARRAAVLVWTGRGYGVMGSSYLTDSFQWITLLMSLSWNALSPSRSRNEKIAQQYWGDGHNSGGTEQKVNSEGLQRLSPDFRVPHQQSCRCLACLCLWGAKLLLVDSSFIPASLLHENDLQQHTDALSFSIQWAFSPFRIFLFLIPPPLGAFYCT